MLLRYSPKSACTCTDGQVNDWTEGVSQRVHLNLDSTIFLISDHVPLVCPPSASLFIISCAVELCLLLLLAKLAVSILFVGWVL